jgi:hypothetical protein
MATLGAKDTYTDVIQIGNQFTVTNAAASTSLVEIWDGYNTLISSTSLAASISKKFGEYRQEYRIKISCLTGSVTYTETTSSGVVVGRATQTNDSAAAGEIGELITSTVAVGAPVSETTATPVDVTSISLTAGDWEVSGQVDRVLTGVTATIYGAGLGVATATLLTQAGGSGVGTDCLTSQTATFGTTLTGNYATKVGPVRVSLSAAATTIYLIAADSFSAGSVGVYGTLRARRVR